MTDTNAYEDFREPEACQRCDGQGEIVTCLIDKCAETDICLHDGEYSTCPDCKGAGEI